MLFSVGVILLFLTILRCQADLNLDEGEVCSQRSEGNWMCTPIDACRHANLSNARTCQIRGRLPIVCCPPKIQNKAQTACRKYLETRKCPTTSTSAMTALPSPDEDDFLIPLVIGGNKSLPKSHPEAVLLGTGSEGKITWQCGGSLISDKWILSAAHCQYPNSNRNPIGWARLGELDYSTDMDDAKPVDRKIVRIVPHPQFKLPPVYHDVALYQMDSPVTFNDYVAPICLHTAFEIGSPEGMVVGWGRTGFADDVSSSLLEANITLVSHDACVRLYGKDQGVPRGIDKMAMICAGEDDGAKDACKGDSGSPLLISEPGSCVNRQIGIVSTGKYCGLPNVPGVYTRVSTYVPWIESIVWP